MSQSAAQSLLQELTRLESLRDPKVTKTQRQFDRYVIRSDAELHPMDLAVQTKAPVPILLRDLSRGGIGFVCSQPLEPNSTWHVSFIKDGYSIGCQGLVVRHCRLIKESTYLAGTQFCVSSGLLAQLGVKPSALRDKEEQFVDHGTPKVAEDPFDDQANFLPPEDL